MVETKFGTRLIVETNFVAALIIVRNAFKIIIGNTFKDSNACPCVPTIQHSPVNRHRDLEMGCYSFHIIMVMLDLSMHNALPVDHFTTSRIRL